ncbi:hypothetical protein [Cellulomonas sp. C5510]|uniref:hypothetical protein n=1 Tax=Cellulomonas sp. C5510 TaxID=2871170 RepID=UPI001C9744CE|nr:hypothetical protein [Cellulomonas sp. C5510]QZN86370.1 hypothetical protein K5O09_04140 [Cellulomonas sp. C5510]
MSAATLIAVAHGAVLQAGGALGEALHTVLPAPAAARVPGAAEPSPSPGTVEIPPEDQTSPGLLGFLVTFAVAAAVIALAFSLVRHLRVVERNARRLEEDEAAAGAGTSAPGGGAPAAGGDRPAAEGDAPATEGEAALGTADGGPAPEDRDRP